MLVFPRVRSGLCFPTAYSPSFLCPGTLPSTAPLMSGTASPSPLFSLIPSLLPFCLGPQHPTLYIPHPQTEPITWAPKLVPLILRPAPVRGATLCPVARPETTIWFPGHISKMIFSVSGVSTLPLATCPTLHPGLGSGLLPGPYLRSPCTPQVSQH